MSFKCKNGPEHTHETVYQSRVCWGLVKPDTHAAPFVKLATDAQLKFIKDLGGDPVHAAKMPIPEASSYIDELKRRKHAVTVAPEPAPAPKVDMTDKRLEFVKVMLSSISPGYYAVQAEEGAEIFFLRISQPKNGKYKGAIKVQSLHGTASSKPRSEDALVLFPTGKYYFMAKYFSDHFRRERLIEAIMLLVTDAWGAQRRYSEKIGRCCRCNAALTDERSRHYGIGPECEKYWPQIIELVDAATDGGA